MHNMIIEDECYLNAPVQYRIEVPTPKVELVEDENHRFRLFLARYRLIKYKETHIALQNTLINHL